VIYKNQILDPRSDQLCVEKMLTDYYSHLKTILIKVAERNFFFFKNKKILNKNILRWEKPGLSMLHIF